MRGPAEIDISRPRYRDEPGSVLRTIASSLRGGEPGHHRAHHARLAGEGEAMARRLIEEAGRGGCGWLRRPVVRRLVRLHRELLPLREHPKYMLVRALALVRHTALEAGALLNQQGRITDPDDVWFLELDELAEAVGDSERVFAPPIAERRATHERYRRLYPPRVLTSEGESPVVHHSTEDMPAGALAGSAVSAGIAEGIARVIRDPEAENLQHGEILIAPFTDPGWTPLFLNAAGLVMEVGGMMTHGSVVAREYGIPAVVCVPDATTKIVTGQRVRVNGDAGYVEVLAPDA